MAGYGARMTYQYPQQPPAPPRRRSPALLVVLVAVAVVLVGAAVAVALALRSDPADPVAAASAATTAATVAAATTPAATPASCPNGRLPSGACAGDPSAAAPGLGDDRVAWTFCPAMLRASTADMSNPDKMEPLGEQAATSQDRGLATGGKLLAERARLARAAKKANHPDQAKFTADLAASGADLAAKCSAAGFKA